MGRRDDHDGIDAHLLESIRHLAHATRLVGHNMGTELLEILTFGWVQGEAGDAVEVLLEVVVGEKELGDEVPSLTVGGGDTDVSFGHGWRLITACGNRSDVCV